MIFTEPQHNILTTFYSSFLQRGLSVKKSYGLLLRATAWKTLQMFKIHWRFLSISALKKIKQCLIIIYCRLKIIYFIWKWRSLLTKKKRGGVFFWNTLCLAEPNFQISFQICVGASSTTASTCTTHCFTPCSFLQSIQRELPVLILLPSNTKWWWCMAQKFLKGQ